MPPPARPRKRAPTRYHHGDLRRALLQAARAVIARDGVDALRMSALAKSLRVSVAAPFRHFPSREALLVALAEEGAAELVARMEEAAAREQDPLLAQRARGVAYVRFVVEDPATFRLLVRREVLDASPSLRAMDASVRALMEPILGRHHGGRASRALARRSAGLLAAQALTYGLARMILDGLLGEVTPAEAEALAAELTNVLGEGLLGPR